MYQEINIKTKSEDFCRDYSLISVIKAEKSFKRSYRVHFYFLDEVVSVNWLIISLFLSWDIWEKLNFDPSHLEYLHGETELISFNT